MTRTRLLSMIVAALSLSACGRFASDDTRGDHAQRIVSVSKQYTEILYALSATDDLVAVDVSSTYPPEAKKLPTVGYHRALSVEGMLAAKPTLILSGGPSNIGPEHVVDQLNALKIPMKYWDVPGDLDGAKTLIRDMGKEFHKEARADSLVAGLESDMARVLDPAKAPTDTPSVAIIHYGQAMNLYFLISQGTAGQMVRWAGGRMAIDTAGFTRMSSPEVLAKANPDVILMTDFGYDRLSGRRDILALPGVAATKAARDGRIFRIEEHDIIYYGPRTGKNVDLIRTLLHQPGTPE
ncbi:MAG: ABC transporter substrate-binding protein [Gemmatimonadaceae bacterium]|nr:ABC transporter substrate-binding protein [Gemmatimonadaceae bacterium]